MNTLEMLGIWMVIILSLGVCFIVAWVISSVWRHGDYIQTLEVKIRYIEDAMRLQNVKRQK